MNPYIFLKSCQRRTCAESTATTYTPSTILYREQPPSPSLPPSNHPPTMTALRVRRQRPAPPVEQPVPDGDLYSSDEENPRASQCEATFNGLPPEIHLLIIKELTYPDALSLKHTSRYFYNLVDTGVRLKVAWLMERRSLHLDCPNDKKCILKTDLEFCRGSVRYVDSFISPCMHAPS